MTKTETETNTMTKTKTNKTMTKENKRRTKKRQQSILVRTYVVKIHFSARHDKHSNENVRNCE